MTSRKILVLSNNCSGLISFRCEVLEALIKEGHTLSVVAPEDFKTDVIKEIGCQYIPIQFNRKGMNPFADIKLMLAYRRIIKRVKPDVVLSYTIKPNLYGGMACRFTHTPQIANITGLGIAAEKKGMLKFIISYLYRFGLKKAHTIYLQNPHDKAYCIQNGLITGRNVLLPGSGVNLTKFSPQDYPLSDKTKFIFIGRIQKRKGIDLYIEAARIIKKRYPNTEFHVLGKCEDSKYDITIKKAENEGYIIYHGYAADIRPFLRDIHCTIHPSYYNEGMSNVLLETCATARPVITTNKAGCADVVENGKNGLIMDQNDVKSLVITIETFLRLSYQKKKEMGEYSRKKIEREFDRNIVVREYLRNIHQIIAW